MAATRSRTMPSPRLSHIDAAPRAGLMIPGFVILGVVGLAAGTALALHNLEKATAKPPRSPRHRVLILGAGFGGIQAAQTLARSPDIDLCVIDRQNHHLFQPLLYQVATAALSPDAISKPIRDEVASGAHARVHMETVTGIDTARREVHCGDHTFPYDTLIVATGSEPSYFGHPTWQGNAPGLKSLSDAMGLRQRILGVFESAANRPANDPDRRTLLTFALIGGGATGVEMAGSIAELANDIRRHEFGGDPAMRARVILIEAGPTLLPSFPHDLATRATNDLAGMGIEIRTGTRVTGIDPKTIHLDESETIQAETIIWTAGVKATPVAEWLGVKPNHGDRVAVEPDLTIGGHPDIFVIGDAALAKGSDGKPLPGVAPVAKQQGQYVASTIIDRLQGRAARRPFTYRDYGTLATIGRNRAVADFGRVHLTGTPAWLTWAIAHIFFLIGFRNRVMVGTEWMIAYLTNQRGGRVIT